jgi:putative component of toxin-antitoxin plasmid stabilization module
MIFATSLMKRGEVPVLRCIPCNADLGQAIAGRCRSLAPGSKMIRIHVLGEWRVIYVAKFSSVVYVLHAFQKKSQKTDRRHIDLARNRYSQIGGGHE